MILHRPHRHHQRRRDLQVFGPCAANVATTCFRPRRQRGITLSARPASLRPRMSRHPGSGTMPASATAWTASAWAFWVGKPCCGGTLCGGRGTCGGMRIWPAVTSAVHPVALGCESWADIGVAQMVLGPQTFPCGLHSTKFQNPGGGGYHGPSCQSPTQLRHDPGLWGIFSDGAHARNRPDVQS